MKKQFNHTSSSLLGHSPRSRQHQLLWSTTLLAILAITGIAGCRATNGQLQTDERIVQRVDVDAPAPPKICDDPARPSTMPTDTAMVVYLFTEEYCDACARELAALDASAQKLRDNNILVVQAVTQSDNSCFNAARLARKSPWPYAATDSAIERNWALRSTPTLWLVNPKNNKTIAYIEGEISADELLSFIPHDHQHPTGG